MIRKLLAIFGRRPGDLTKPALAGSPVPDEPESYTHLEAAQLVLGLIQAELVLHEHVPANLNLVADEVFPLIPASIRGPDTPVNRAEFAHVLHRGILFLDAVGRALDERAPGVKGVQP